MRDASVPLSEVLSDLSAYARDSLKRPRLEALCQVELGLYVQEIVTPGAAAAEAWVLFSGYPFARVRGVAVDPEHDKMLHAVRYTMWTLRRRRAWRDALEAYQRIERPLRGYEVGSPDEPSTRCGISVANQRWDVYRSLLHRAPPLVGDVLAQAGPGPHGFLIGRNMATVDLPDLAVPPPVGHSMDTLPVGGGVPLTFTWAELLATAAKMEARSPRDWIGRLKRVRLSTSNGDGFAPTQKFTVDGMQHLLGIVGAGKSTLRDVLAIHMVNERKRRVTIVVGDVAEVLKLVELYNTYTDRCQAAAPVIGASGRQKHAQRLHRRLAGRGEHRLLAHDDPGFSYLSTSCVVNTLRPHAPEGEVLGYGESPCTRLLPPSRRKATPGSESGAPRWQRTRRACPYWSVCPRHHASHVLVEADIWVATPASLVDVSTEWPQNGKNVRYLELACRRSDLVIVDEADRVQTQLDRMFAPDVPLIGKGGESAFLDDLNGHTIQELVVGGRTQLSDRDVENWSAALNTATAATNRLYAMLVGDHSLRRWVRIGYFSAWTLQKGLLDECYPLGEADDADPHREARESLGDRLDAFRDNPFGDRANHGQALPELTSVLTELLHTNSPERTRGRLATVLDELFDLHETVMPRKRAEYQEVRAHQEREDEQRLKIGKKPKKRRKRLQTPEEWHEALVRRFEFTLMLCALEPRLALINAMWPRVEAVLNLRFNSMYRRPVDYGPMVPEAPMGNVIGFQFLVDGPDKGGVRSGELTFFRYSGVGRELLRVMPSLPTVDGRPGTNVLLMSGSSWAGLSSRYHVAVPVGVMIEPLPAEMTSIVNDTYMRVEFVVEDREALTASGAGLDLRPDVLCRMATSLGASAPEADNGGPLELELRALPEKRRHILLLVGSYDEARLVADTLHNLNSRWKDRVLRLVADDEEIEIDDTFADDEYQARVLRRGDVESLADCNADLLVAPLLAVERGHNILDDGVAAIGTVYFLIRPNPRPDDMSLAVHSMNDWIVRAGQTHQFRDWVRTGTTLEEGALEVRRQARKEWYRLLNRSTAWSRLGDDRAQVTWDLLVLMWQVIGRLVRGGVPARVVFVDAAFMPNQAAEPSGPDTPESSLLHSVHHVLGPYFTTGSEVSLPARQIVRALYRPLWAALNRCLHPESISSTEEGNQPCTR